MFERFGKDVVIQTLMLGGDAEPKDRIADLPSTQYDKRPVRGVEEIEIYERARRIYRRARRNVPGKAAGIL